jgi:hypothetical protein
MHKLLALIILLASLAHPLPEPEVFGTPVPFLQESIKREFSPPSARFAPGHRGIDIKALAPFQSPVLGTVTFRGLVNNRMVLTIRSDRGYLLSFEPICSELEVGGRVARGQLIGSYCAGEVDYEPHCESCVHFSVRTARGYLNPLLFYRLLRPSVLLA